MLGRYAELKAQLPPETILLYQVGTFFETFEEDAKRISQALSIRLTSREAAGEGRVPLAGVPGHANYLAAFVVRDGRAGIAVVEASTGEFTGTEVSEEQLPAELERWSPREIVVPERTAAEKLPKVRAAVISAPRWTFGNDDLAR